MSSLTDQQEVKATLFHLLILVIIGLLSLVCVCFPVTDLSFYLYHTFPYSFSLYVSIFNMLHFLYINTRNKLHMDFPLWYL